MGNFTDLPDVRTVELSDADNHLGMQFVEITEGFCMIDAQATTTNYDGEVTSSVSSVGGNRDKSVIIKPTPPTPSRPNEKCLNATLRLWLQEPIDDDLTLSLHRLLKDWVRDEVTWEQASSGDNWDAPGLTAGVDYELTAEISGTIGDLRGSPYVDFELDTWVNDVCNDGADNFGFILIGSDGSDFSQVIYGEGAPYQQRPVLIVETAYQEQMDCTQDSYVDESNPDTNYEALTLIAASDPFGAGNSKHSVFQFDISSLTFGAEVQSALFWLSVNTASGGTEMGVYPILQSWEEDGVTWNSRNGTDDWTTAGLGAGTDYDDTQRVEWIWNNSSDEYISVDITDIVKQWKVGSLDNNGLLLRFENASAGSKNVNSRDGVLPPYIEVVYRT